MSAVILYPLIINCNLLCLQPVLSSLSLTVSILFLCTSIGYFPWRMISRSRLGSKFFHRDGDVRYEELSNSSKEEVRNCLHLREFCRRAMQTNVSSGNSGQRDERNFYQLLRELLILDPKSRVTAKDALSMAYLDSNRRR